MLRKFLIAVALLSQITTASKCCQFFCDKAACVSSEYGCKWLEQGVADALIVDGIQCRSLLWGECGQCCPSCPPSPNLGSPIHCPFTQDCSITPPPTTSAPTTPAPTTVSPTSAPTVLSYAEMCAPRRVKDFIDEDTKDGCSCKLTNCLESPDERGKNALYSPNSITFQGVEFSEENNACCYKYTSEYLDGAVKDCIGRSKPQSYLMMDVDCGKRDFEVITKRKNGYQSYGLDDATCMKGLMIDNECSGVCDYEVCIRYSSIPAGECPWTKSWVMVRAGKAFSFAGLKGLPSCNAYTGTTTDEKWRVAKRFAEEDADDADSEEERVLSVDTVVVSGAGRYVQFDSAQTTALIMVVAVLCAALLYYGRNKKRDEYKLLRDNNSAAATTYLSTV